MLALALLPLAVANADDWTITPDPTSTETITGIYGLQPAPPALEESLQGSQLFDYTNGSKFYGLESHSNDGLGLNTEVYVASDVTGTGGPSVGSVFDTYSLGYGYESVYSDMVSTTGGSNVISETLATPFGDYTIPVTFDAAADAFNNVAASTLANDYGIVDTGSLPETIEAVSGVPPLDVAYQYDPQTFEVVGTTGTFNAAETTTTDLFGTHTEALLVTSTSDPASTAAGDVPPVGSVFNVTNFFDGYQLVYSDLPSTTPGGPDVISDTLVTPFGDYPVPETLDTATVPDNDAVTAALADVGIVPDGSETYTGINGVPPLDVTIQGTQTFDVGDGSFGADVSTSSNSSGYVEEALLVTSTSGPTSTVAGDLPPVGSEFDIYTFGDFTNVYADLASTTPGGADVISDTLVTPLGDFTIPLSEAVAGIAAYSFPMLP